MNPFVKESWKEFLNKDNNSKIQHSLEFREVIKKSYKNCISKYFMDENCLYPFFLVKSKLFKNRLISVPFLDVGGFLGKVNKKTINEIINDSKNLGVKKIEVRLNTFLENFEDAEKILIKLGFKEEKSKQQLIINLSSENKMWREFHKHTRNDIRKAKKSELILKEIKEEKDLKKFYKLYIREMKNFGTPQHSYKFFKNIFLIMKNKFYGLNCYLNKKLIASIILLYHGEYGYIGFNISNREYREYRPNDLLYWESIKWAIKKGIKYLDMGQVEKDAKKESPAYGLYKFKNKWLGKLYNRVYFYYSFEQEKKPQEKKASLKKLRKIWRKIPLPIIKLIGPYITKQLAI